jgi:hypothetical protein
MLTAASMFKAHEANKSIPNRDRYDDLACRPEPTQLPAKDISKDVESTAEYVVNNVPEEQYMEFIKRLKDILENKLIGQATNAEKIFRERTALLEQFNTKS